jgi:two-component system, OmpR family, sensor kinase
MRTPSLRRRVAITTMVAVALLNAVFGTAIYVAQRVSLNASLQALLDDRAETAANIVADVPPDERAERLTAVGIPAVVVAPDGTVQAATPLTQRSSPAPPLPGQVLGPPVLSRSVSLSDGGQVVVQASGAGVQRALRQLAWVLVVGFVVVTGLATLLLRSTTGLVVAPLNALVSATRRTPWDSRGAPRLHPDEPDTELGRLATSYDDTLDELEAALEAARASDRRSQRFLHDAAHQLRTPLAVIRGSLEALLLADGPEERDRLMMHVIRETSRAGRLIASLLQMARLDAGTAPSPTEVDVVELCTGELDRLATLAPWLTGQLHVTDGRTPTVLGDPDAFADALGNVLDNARRHAAGRIDVSVVVTDVVAIHVRDDGPGLTPGEEELVFERFSSRDGKGGSGLGLPIARAVAESAGGTLTWEAGAFVFRLPVLPQEARSERSPASTVPS